MHPAVARGVGERWTGRRGVGRAAGIVLAALVAAGALAMPAAARATAQTLTGTLQVAVADDFAGGRAAESYAIDTGTAVVPLHVGAAARAFAGARISVAGTRLADGSFAAAPGAVELLAPSPARIRAAVPAAAATRRIIVVLATLTDLTTAPATTADATADYNGSGPSVKTFFETTSRGRVTTSATVVGPWALPVAGCSGGTPANPMTVVWPAVHTALTSHGIDDADYDHVVVWTRQPSCAGFAGVAQVFGNYVWVDYPYVAPFAGRPSIATMVVTHEIGHNLGLYHANALLCHDGSGAQTSITGTCSSAEYADEFSTMGAAGRPYPLLDSEELRELGWMESSELRTVSATGSYTLVPTYSTAAGTRLLRIARGSVASGIEPGYLTLELRSLIPGSGFDQFTSTDPTHWATTGVTIRFAEGESFAPSYLIDTVANAASAGNADVSDAPLQAGATFTDTVGGLAITVDSVTAAGATVSIVMVGPPGPPRNVAAVPGNASAAVTWQAPSFDGGSAITKYVVTSSPDAKTCTATSGLACTVSGLTNGRSYTFTVKATNANGTGPASAASAPVVPATVPGAPTGVSAVAENAAADVRWSAPASNGGDAIRTYTATASPGGAHCTVTALSCRISGLTNGTSYTFTVRATNGVGTGPASSASLPVVPVAIVRYSGTSRFATAADVSKKTFTDITAVDAVYVANAYNFPDALAGAAAAGTVHGPVLLAAQSGALDPATIGELQRIHPKKIVVLGGTGAISFAVLNALKSYSSTVVRYSGTSRFATAADVSAHTFTNVSAVDAVYVANATNFPDALAGAAAAGTVHGPVLLANATGPLDPDTARELARLQPKKIVVLGSTGAISEDVLNRLGSYSANVVRAAGTSRFGTAADVSEKTFADLSAVDAVYVANAYSFPDALAGAAAAGTVQGPVLLAAQTGPLDAATVAELTRLQPKKIVVLGGTGAIGADVFEALKEFLPK